MAERVYFDRKRDRVRITSTRAVFADKTYALAAITSVEARRLDPERSLPYGVILAGVVACGVAAFFFLESVLLGASVLMLGLGVVVLGAVWGLQIGPTYAVILRTSGGERKALVSADKGEIKEIVDALNDAIIDRG